MEGKAQHLLHAIEALDQLGPAGKWPRPGNPDKVANKVAERNSDGQLIDLFKSEFWSAGTYLIYDLLAAKYAPNDVPVECEKTPILVVNTVLGQKNASVLRLTVERRHGGGGLVLPDWWSLGLLAFSGKGEDNFRTAIENAIAAGQPEDGYRHYWRLSHCHGFRAEAISGRSAQAAAACCILALNERSAQFPGPLLDQQAAVSACLKQLTGEVNKIELAPVEARSFEDKLDAAARAGLHDVTFFTGQWPVKKNVHEVMSEIKGQKQKQSVYLCGITLLADAYDNLVHNSRAIRNYKQEIVIDWQGGLDNKGNALRDDKGQIRGHWIEEKTHEDFKNAS